MCMVTPVDVGKVTGDVPGVAGGVFGDTVHSPGSTQSATVAFACARQGTRTVCDVARTYPYIRSHVRVGCNCIIDEPI